MLVHNQVITVVLKEENTDIFYCDLELENITIAKYAFLSMFTSPHLTNHMTIGKNIQPLVQYKLLFHYCHSLLYIYVVFSCYCA